MFLVSTPRSIDVRGRGRGNALSHSLLGSTMAHAVSPLSRITAHLPRYGCSYCLLPRWNIYMVHTMFSFWILAVFEISEQHFSQNLNYCSRLRYFSALVVGKSPCKRIFQCSFSRSSYSSRLFEKSTLIFLLTPIPTRYGSLTMAGHGHKPPQIRAVGGA